MIGTRHLTAHIIIYVMFLISSTAPNSTTQAPFVQNMHATLDLTGWRQISSFFSFSTSFVPTTSLQCEWKWNKCEICSIDIANCNFWWIFNNAVLNGEHCMMANAVKVMKAEWVIDRMSRSLRLISINVPNETWIFVNYIDVELWFKWEYACCLNGLMRRPMIYFTYTECVCVCVCFFQDISGTSQTYILIQPIRRPVTSWKVSIQ